MGRLFPRLLGAPHILKVGAARANDTPTGRDDCSGLTKREFSDIARVRRVRGECETSDAPLRCAHRQNCWAIPASDHLTPPKDLRLGLRYIRSDTKRQSPTETGLPLEREDQTGEFWRATSNFGLEREAALVPFNVRQSDLRKVEAGIPHQRPVAVDPKIASFRPIGKEAAPGLFDFLVRMAPTFGVAGFAGALIVDGEDLTRDAHGRLIRRCQPAVKVRHMNERVMGHSRYFCVVMDSESWDERQVCDDLIPPPKSVEDIVAVQVRLVKALCNVRFGSKADMCAAKRRVRFTPESGHSLAHLVFYVGVSHPAPHPLNVVFVSCSELTAHLGFLEGDVDPISGGEEGDRCNEHWPSADP